MKRIILFVTVLAFATLTYAQKPANQATPEQRATQITKKMTQELGLNATQEAKVKEISLAAAKRNDAIKQQQKDVKTQLKESETTRDADLQKVLTTEQFAKYKQQKEAKKQEMLQKRTEKKDTPKK